MSFLQPQDKQVQLEQLQYELGACERRHKAEMAGMRQTVTNMEIQLAEARREADEYHKANIEANVQSTALGNQVLNFFLSPAEQSSRGTLNWVPSVRPSVRPSVLPSGHLVSAIVSYI